MSHVPFLPENAPFSPEQRSWLNGYLAGLFSNAPAGDMPVPEPAAPPARLLILYGSQTGTAEGLAMETADRAGSFGFTTEVKELDDIEPAALTSEERVLVITSTYGDGEMPDNAQSFWSAISADDAPSLSNLKYSVLALGDTNYETFCTAGKDLDARFLALGANSVAARVDCDVEYEEPFEGWVEQALTALKPDDATATATVEAPAKKATGYSKKNPYNARILENTLLTAEESGKEVRHYAIQLPASELTYEAGDALSVFPENNPDVVEALLKDLSLEGSADVTVGKQVLSLREALERELDVRLPTKPQLQALAERSGNEEIAKLLDDADALSEHLWGREIHDYLQLAGGAWTAQELADFLKPLQPRAYSISSAPGAHPDEVHLCVASVRYEGAGKDREGVCSTYLADRVGDRPLRVFVTPNKHFKVPADPEAPMIMVGPGTGIAPFRAFLEERKVRGDSGPNWLFFGDRSEKTDFLYQKDLETYTEENLLTRLDLAWSRDQEEKIYVQNRMLEHGEELYAWLEKGGYFFVCGDAYRMAKDVEKALLEILAEYGGGPEAAAAKLDTLKKEKRYVRDVY